MKLNRSTGWMCGVYAITFLIGSVTVLSAQTVISWTGGNGNWGTASNWSGNNIPNNSSEVASFDSSTLNTTINQNVNNLTIGELNYSAGAISRTISGSQLSLAGYNGIGLVDNSANTQTIAASLNFTSAQTWQINSGVLNITGVLTNNNYQQLTKTGGGTLILSGNNTFQGPLVINGGTLRLANNNAMGTSGYDNVIASGAALELTNNITVNEGGIGISGTGVGGNGVLRNLSGNNTLSTQLTLNGDSRIQADTGTLSLSGQFQAKTHDLTLAGNGAIVINPNITDLGNLTLTDAGNRRFTGNLGLSGALSIQNTGTNVFNGIVSANSLAITTSSTNTFNAAAQISGAITINSSANQSFNAQVNATSFTMTGGGTVTLAGNTSNAISGVTTVNAGTLVLDKSDGTDAMQASLVINAGTVRWASNNQILDSNNVSVTVNAPGVMDLNNYNEGIDKLIMTQGTVTTGTGILTITNTGGTSVITNSSSSPSVINGHLAFSGWNQTISVADGSAASDLVVNATVDAAHGFVKVGAGTVEFDKAVSSGGSDQWNNAIEIHEGTMLLGASNIVADNAPIKLSGGTLATGGHSDSMGSLTLSNNSTIDMGNGNSILAFTNANYSGGTLTVSNWSGNANGGGTDQILFTTTLPSQTFLNNVYWADYGTTGAKMIGNEMVPISMPIVPELSTIVGGGLLAAFIFLREWLRRRRKVSA